MAPVISSNEYHTPKNVKYSLLKKLHLPLWFSFYMHIYYIIFIGWVSAKLKRFDNAFWIKESNLTKEAVESNGGRIHIDGLDNIKSVDGPVVFIGNHMSTLETFLLPFLIEPLKTFTFVVKQKLLTIGFFGPIMRSRDPIAVGRTNPKDDLKAVLQQGAEKLAAGKSIVIFPQSTRSSKFMPEHFNTLGVKLAKKANVPIIPIALKTDFWGNGKWLRDFGPVGRSKDVYITFGKPMNVKATGKEEHNQIVDFITAHLKKWV